MTTTPRKQSVARWFSRTYIGRIIIALVLIVVVQLALFWLIVVLPYQREQRIEEKIEAVRGKVYWVYRGPSWIPNALLLLHEPVPVFDRIYAVRLHNCKMSKELFLSLATLTCLNTLDFGKAQVSDVDLENLRGITSLNDLNPVDTQITDVELGYLPGMMSLQHLFLARTQITSEGLKCLKGMTTLDTLALSQTQINDVGLEHLKEMTGIRTLLLDGTQITDAGLEYLREMTSLKKLFINDTKTTPEGRAMLRNALPSCWITPEPVTR